MGQFVIEMDPEVVAWTESAGENELEAFLGLVRRLRELDPIDGCSVGQQNGPNGAHRFMELSGGVLVFFTIAKQFRAVLINRVIDAAQ